MLTTYTVLKTVHILAAAVWLGGGLMLTILGIRARRAAEPDALVRIFREANFVAPRTFLPASLVLVATGFALVGSGELGYDTWVILAIVGWALTTINGMAGVGPQSAKAERLLAEHGPTSEVALAQVRRTLAIARVDYVILALVVADMVIKPG